MKNKILFIGLLVILTGILSNSPAKASGGAAAVASIISASNQAMMYSGGLETLVDNLFVETVRFKITEGDTNRILFLLNKHGIFPISSHYVSPTEYINQKLPKVKILGIIWNFYSYKVFILYTK